MKRRIMNTRDVLERMLQVFEEKNWVQGTMFEVPYPNRYWGYPPVTNITGVCLEGACQLAMNQGLPGWALPDNWSVVFDDIHNLIIKSAQELCPDKYLPGMRFMHEFNDLADVTWEDIILVTKHALYMTLASQQSQALDEETLPREAASSS